MQSKYGFGKKVETSFEETVAKTIEALKTEGFGILTQIDAKATLKEKLGEDIPPYLILGACNPPYAHRALSAEPSIGLLLPCNVVVRQTADGGVIVEMMDPAVMIKLADNPAINELACEVKDKLKKALDAI